MRLAQRLMAGRESEDYQQENHHGDERRSDTGRVVDGEWRNQGTCSEAHREVVCVRAHYTGHDRVGDPSSAR